LLKALDLARSQYASLIQIATNSLFYSGSGDRPPEQLTREVVDSELRPRLQQGGGLTRYITFIADDGRLGSASVYENKADAQKGLQIAREWAGATKAMQGYQRSQTLTTSMQNRIERAPLDHERNACGGYSLPVHAVLSPD